MAFLAFLAVFAVLSASSCSAAHDQELVLALDDTFDDFNLSLWKHEITLGGGGNWEFQWYTNNRTNSYVEDGVLHIRPTLTRDDIGEDAVRGGTANVWGAQPANLCTGNAFFGCERNAAFGNVNNPVRSARIRTAESFSFTYGKVEVRAKLPRGDWLWPAIWMLPTDYQYGDWPASGEIDIMESRGNPPSYPPGGYNTFGSTLHWGMNYRENRFDRTHQVLNSTVDFSADFHTYGLVWNETYIGTYLDDESNTILEVPITQSFFEFGEWNESNWWNPWRGRGDNAPFDRRFFLVINLAVGGVNFFPDGFGKPWNNTQGSTINDFYSAVDDWWPTWTQSFQIDSVRVWTYQEPETTSCPPTTDSTVIQLMKSNVLGVFALAIALSVGMFKYFN